MDYATKAGLVCDVSSLRNDFILQSFLPLPLTTRTGCRRVMIFHSLNLSPHRQYNLRNKFTGYNVVSWASSWYQVKRYGSKFTCTTPRHEQNFVVNRDISKIKNIILLMVIILIEHTHCLQNNRSRQKERGGGGFRWRCYHNTT